MADSNATAACRRIEEQSAISRHAALCCTERHTIFARRRWSLLVGAAAMAIGVMNGVHAAPVIPSEPACVKELVNKSGSLKAATDAFGSAAGKDFLDRSEIAGAAYFEAEKCSAYLPVAFVGAGLWFLEMKNLVDACPYMDNNGHITDPTLAPDQHCQAQEKTLMSHVQQYADIVIWLSDGCHQAVDDVVKANSLKLPDPVKKTAANLQDTIRTFSSQAKSCGREASAFVTAAKAALAPSKVARGAQSAAGKAGAVVVGGAKDALDTGKRAAGGAVVVAGTVGDTAKDGAKTAGGYVVRGAGGAIDLGGKAADTSKTVVGDVIKSGSDAAAAVTNLTSFDGYLGSQLAIHLDNGTAKVASGSVTLDGGMTIALKSNPAAKLVVNGHLVLKAGATGPTPGNLPSSSGSAAGVGRVQSPNVDIAGGATATASTGSSGRVWTTLEGNGSVTVAMGTYTLPLTGNRSLWSGNNSVFIGGGFDIKGCHQESQDTFQLDGSGVTSEGKLTCGNLVLEQSKINVTPAGNVSGSGKLALVGHEFVFTYDLSGTRLKAHQQAKWSTTVWTGIPGIPVEYRVSNPAVDVNIDGASASLSLSTSGVGVRTTAKKGNGDAWASASGPGKTYTIAANGTVTLPLPGLNNPPDADKDARDVCLKVANKIPNPEARSAATSVCNSDHPAPPAIPTLPNPFNVDLAKILGNT